MKKVAIFGSKQFIQITPFSLINDSSYKIVAFTINRQFITEEKLLELPVIL